MSGRGCRLRLGVCCVLDEVWGRTGGRSRLDDGSSSCAGLERSRRSGWPDRARFAGRRGAGSTGRCRFVLAFAGVIVENESEGEIREMVCAWVGK